MLADLVLDNGIEQVLTRRENCTLFNVISNEQMETQILMPCNFAKWLLLWQLQGD
jgi:hypothetical protein